METSGNAVLKIYASSTDRYGSKLLYEHIVHKAKDNGVSGVTVYRGIMGYGQSSHINSSKFWELTEKLPVMIEIVDNAETLETFYNLIEPDLHKMPKGCLVTIEPVTVKLQKPGNTKKQII
jgi:PII-like signaling protein